jgi:cytochrome oxidase Cu insertion factor (SCO1/SenC/PrrC family)
LGFAGNDLLQHSGDYFTLNQKIYSNYKEFKDFQFVFIAPEGTEEQALKLENAFGKLSEMSGYHFVFAPLNEIQAYYSKLHLIGKLDVTGHTPFVFIVDKKRNLRGRKGKSVQGEAEYKEGYNTTSAAELHNEMVDDVKILLAEYRLALKRNNSQRKI